MFEGTSVLVGITGGIAAYKAAELVRCLVKAGAQVRVIMTAAAQQFITPLTLQTLSGQPVGTDLFGLESEARIGHIHMARAAQLVVVAPATANIMAKMAAGIADDYLTTTVLAGKAPVLICPAHERSHVGAPGNQTERRHPPGAGLSRAGARVGCTGVQGGRCRPPGRYIDHPGDLSPSPDPPDPPGETRPGECGAHLGVFGPGPFHQQPFHGQDGLRPCRRGRPAARPKSTWSRGPLIFPLRTE